MTPTKKPDAEKRNAEREAALTFVRMAKEKGLDLTGPDGLLKQFTKSVLARSSRSSSGNGSGGCPGWTRWCCPCMPGA